MIHTGNGGHMKLSGNQYEPKEIMKFIRQWTELDKKTFAKSIGKSLKTIQNYEQGRNTYSIETLQKIASIHHLNIIIETKER